MKKYLSLTAIPLLLVVFLMSSCAKPSPAGLTDQQVNSITENVLKAINANDYQGFIKDFSDKMKSVFPQAEFDKLCSLLQTASGNYVSLGASSMTNNQGYAAYRFPAKYANETVYVTVTFLVGGQKVEGLWFDSAALRKASQ